MKNPFKKSRATVPLRRNELAHAGHETTLQDVNQDSTASYKRKLYINQIVSVFAQGGGGELHLHGICGAHVHLCYGGPGH